MWSVSHKQEEGASRRAGPGCRWGWSLGASPAPGGLAHPQVISFLFFFWPSLFLTRKGLEAPVHILLRGSCLRLGEALGDAVATGAGTTPVPAFPLLPDTQPPALHMPEPQCKWYTLSCPGQLSARPSFPFPPST